MREGNKVSTTAGGVASLEGHLLNSRAPKIAIYLLTYICMRVTHRFIAAAQTAYSRAPRGAGPQIVNKLA